MKSRAKPKRKATKKAGESDISRFAELTSAERKLLEILIDASTRLLPITEIAKKAGISRKTYYQIFERKNFCDLYEREVRSIYRRDAMSASHALAAGARRGDVVCIRLLLELANIYQPKSKVAVDATVETIQKISEADFVKWLREAQGMSIITRKVIAQERTEPPVKSLPEPAVIDVKPEPEPAPAPAPLAAIAAPEEPKMYHPPSIAQQQEAKLREGAGGWQSPRRWRR
ncbi:MAG TPA: phBC6A51 family helix-turn-helix protein [Nitrospirota bacterium]|nr:phBC6A51 family helix-turn-helix protein [Nitrospirota bacterium]